MLARPLIELKKSTKLALLGPNGSGKSTMLKEFVGLDVAHITARLGHLPKLQSIDRLRASYVPQNHSYPEDLRLEEFWSWHFDVLDNGLGYASEFEYSLEKLQVKSTTRWSELSGGQQQYLRLRRSLADHKDVLVWDEALQHLDSRLRREIAHEMRERTVIFATHNSNEVRFIAKEALVHTTSGTWEYLSLDSPQALRVLEDLEFK